MSAIKIEKGVPIPPRGRWPLDKMGVGDMFFAPGDAAEAGRCASRARNYGRSQNKKFIVRKVVRGDVRGFGVWRIK